MWENLMRFDVPAANLFVRGTVIYLAVLFLIRLSGKRQVAQMGTTEFVAILLISNAVQNSMNGGDNSLVGGVLLAFVLIALCYLISVLTYNSKFFRGVFEGVPRLLVHEGRPVSANLRKERLSEEELRSLMRKQGVHHYKELKSAVLESDGTFSIIRYSDLN